MTTQEQDKLCRTCIHTLSTDSHDPPDQPSIL